MTFDACHWTNLQDCKTTGWCVLTLPDDAPKPDLVSGLHTCPPTKSSASISQVFRNSVQKFKRTSIGLFGAAIRVCKSINRDMHETVNEALANRWCAYSLLSASAITQAKSAKIGALDILESKEQGFQADMADFVQLIQKNCQRTKNITELLNLISCMQTTSEVMSESPANLHSDFMWKSTADVYNGFFALLTASAHAQSEAFFRCKKSGRQLDSALLQRMNHFLYKIMSRPIWLRFFLHTASQNTACMNSELVEYALSQISPLVSTALELAGMEASSDGHADMISLEKMIDSSQCLMMETDPFAKPRHFKANLFLSAPSRQLCSNQQLPLPAKLMHTISCRQVIFDPRQHGKKRGGRVALGETLTILCAGDFILVGSDEKAASREGSVFRLRYAPVPLKSVTARQYDVYGSLENVVELNLCDSVLIAVQTHGAEDRLLLTRFLNMAKQTSVAPITPNFWLVDKPVESAAVLYTDAPHSEITKPRITVFQCLCHPYISKDGSWEKLPKCAFEIVTEFNGSSPRIVLSLDATKKRLATMDVHVEMDVRISGTRGLILLMKNLTTGSLRPYLVNVKDSKIREELLESVRNIKSSLSLTNFNGMAQNAVLKNVPDFIHMCPDLEAKCLWFDCIVNVKMATNGSSKIHQLGLSKLCLKTLASPVGTFKIATLTSESNPTLKYLETLITSDTLVQDFRTPACTLIKMKFKSKPGIQYSIELVSDKPKESVFCKSPPNNTAQKIPVHPILSEIILKFLCKDTLAHESVFRTPGPAHLEPRVIASSPSNTAEPAAEPAAVPFSEPAADPAADSTAGTAVMTVVETPAETFVEPAVQTASETTMETPADTHCASPVKIEHTVTTKNVGARVGGWVASKVHFFNGLAEQSTTPAVSASTEIKALKEVPAVAASAEVMPGDSVAAVAISAAPAPAPARTRARARGRPPAPVGAPGPARTFARVRTVELPSVTTIEQEAEKWVSYFSQPHNVANDEASYR
ncbi:hypothetical protein HDU77_008632 [Chytriomyces hyalinus]|nr:hypothetical protein HDU77_008632 [Chytriomyces hyalinus]